jgi:hypothetical protein
LPPKASLAAAQRWTLGSLKAGAAALGLSILVFSESPPAILALMAVSLVVLGGTAWTGIRGPLPLRLLVPVAAAVAARVAAGPAAAAITALLLALGGLLRVRLPDGVAGLAVFGGAVALVGGASVRLALTFWLVGLATIAVPAVARRLRRASIRHALSGMRDERPSSPS